MGGEARGGEVNTLNSRRRADQKKKNRTERGEKIGRERKTRGEKNMEKKEEQ